MDPSIILTIAGTFLLAGTVKGVIGLGLPTISLALLTVAIDLPHAMALLLVPSLGGNHLLNAELGGLSAAALLPALAGMVLGQRVRRHLSEALFRRLLFGALLVLGAYIIAGNLTAPL